MEQYNNITNTSVHAPCVTHNPSSSTVIYVLFMVAVLVTSVIGNVLVLIAAFMSPVLKIRATTYFICSLACSDFLLAVTLIPFRISTKLYDSWFCHSLEACYFFIIADAFGNIASILNLLVIAVDRYVAINRTFRYPEIITKKRAVLLLALIWSVAVTIAIASVLKINTKTGSISEVQVERVCRNMNPSFYVVIFVGVYFSSLIFMTIGYASIFSVAISHIKAIEVTETVNHSCHLKVSGCKRKHRRHMRELKTTKSLAMVYGAFVACWFPSFVITFIILIDSKHFYEMQKKNEAAFLFIYYAFIEVLPTLNTTLNPFIYSFSNQQYREAFANVLRKIKRNAMSDDIGTSSKSINTSVASNLSLNGLLNKNQRTTTA